MKLLISILIGICITLDSCLTAPAKEGFCPVNKKHCDGQSSSSSCQNDNNCPGKLKCCKVGCNDVCVKPQSTEAVTEAPLEQVTVKGEKPGYCGIVTTKSCKKGFSASCSKDVECTGQLKCCQVGCNMKCVRPHSDPPSVLETLDIETSPALPPSHPGKSAPPPPVKGFCPINSRKCKTGETSFCTEDEHCRNNMKCCTIGCHTKCMEPLAEQPEVETNSESPATTKQPSTRKPKKPTKPPVVQPSEATTKKTPKPRTSKPPTEKPETPTKSPPNTKTPKPKPEKPKPTPKLPPNTKTPKPKPTTKPSQPPPKVEKMPSESGEYRYAAVGSDYGICSSVGIEILAKHRGSAVDAAIATLLCIGVVHFESSGIGGGCFMTIYDTPNNGSNEKILNTILARERAPLLAKEDMFVGKDASSTVGGLAIAVPGEIKGFHEAWLKFGRVPWNVLFQASIKIAKTGFVVDRFTDFTIRFADSQGLVRKFPELSKLLVKKSGSLVKEGDIIRRPKYAETLEILSKDPNAFYDKKSKLAKDIVADITDNGGIISLKDLQIYKVYDKDPISVHLNNGDSTVYGGRPPTSGVVLEFILNILDEYKFDPADFSSIKKKTLTLHRIVEAFKFAYAKRSSLGDEEFVDGLDELLKNMTSDDFAKEIHGKIDDDRTHDVEFYEPDFSNEDTFGTSHINVYGPDGSAVSATSTVNLFFGSKIVGKRTGIVFNNEMDDFSTPGTVNSFGVPASPSNFIKPRKMPMSSMSPTIILNKSGQVQFIAGGAGGSRITTSTSMVTALTLWMGLNVSAATDFPRVHHQLVPNHIEVESSMNKAIVSGLKRRGHKIAEPPIFGRVQSIKNDCRSNRRNYIDDYNENCIQAVADGRVGGKPDGY